MQTKICTKCKESKDLTLFSKNSSIKTGYTSTCKECTNLNRRTSHILTDEMKATSKNYREANKEAISACKKAWYRKHAKSISNKNKSRRTADTIDVLIKERSYRCSPDMEFSITTDDFVNLPTICPILGIPIIVSESRTTVNSPSLDRIDNAKGYTKDNTWIISHLANRMKNNGSDEVLYNFCNWILGRGFKSEIQDNYDSFNNYRGCRERARVRGLPFTLSREDIKVPLLCPVLGIPLKRSNAGFNPNAASVDRIIPELGYTKENIQIISMRANTMKNNATPDQLLAFATWFLNQRKEINESI